MQYSLLVFEIVFYNPCNITNGTYKGVGEWEGAEGGGGQCTSRRRALPAIRPQTVVLCSHQTTGMYTNHRIDQDGHWQLLSTQWVNRPCNAPTWFYRVGKKPSVKADPAIYSHAVDVRGQCMSESLILGHNLDFSSCDIMLDFCKSSHVCDCPSKNPHSSHQN